MHDHDFPYDIYRNIGCITLGTSHDTSESARACIRKRWTEHGKSEYPEADSVLPLRDCGGNNNACCYIFKEDLQKLSDELNIEIRIAHYPPYTSKYNPIEHRLFQHITRACEGVVFKSIEIVNEVMSGTKTSAGLKVFTSVLDRVFETGRKASEGFKKNMKIKFDNFLPKWNYVAVPSGRNQFPQLFNFRS